MVPELEAREAAVYTLIPWHDWINLDYGERAMAVAHYRLHLSIQSHITDAAETKARSETARAQARQRARAG